MKKRAKKASRGAKKHGRGASKHAKDSKVRKIKRWQANHKHKKRKR